MREERGEEHGNILALAWFIVPVLCVEISGTHTYTYMPMLSYTHTTYVYSLYLIYIMYVYNHTKLRETVRERARYIIYLCIQYYIKEYNKIGCELNATSF